jgi:hypothetical protein
MPDLPLPGAGDDRTGTRVRSRAAADVRVWRGFDGAAASTSPATRRSQALTRRRLRPCGSTFAFFVRLEDYEKLKTMGGGAFGAVCSAGYEGTDLFAVQTPLMVENLRLCPS